MSSLIPKVDLTGQQFGWLTVLEYKGTDKYRNPMWLCSCQCGNFVEKQKRTLLNPIRPGTIKSCGCVALKVKDLTGQRFGKLVAIKLLPRDENGTSKFLFKCDCGNDFIRRGGEVSCGNIQSCGCINEERYHRLCGHPLNSVWHSMTARCRDLNNPIYGGRGISVCPEWSHKLGFIAFYEWALANEWREGLVIDRRDFNGNYEPSNCRWITPLENANNTRTTPKHAVFGELLTRSEACRKYKIKYSRLTYFTKIKGLSLEDAVKKGPGK